MSFSELLSLLLQVLAGKKKLKQFTNLVQKKFSTPATTVSYQPVVLSISPSDRCNLRCDMCLTHSPRSETNPYRHKPAQDMDYTLFCQIVDRFDTATSLQLIGTGEPLLSKDYFRMVAYAANQKKMAVCSTFNGTLVGDYIEEIITAPLSSINLSVNSYTAEDFHRITGEPPEKYQLICDNVAALTARKHWSSAHITASFIVDQHNYQHLEAMIRTGERLGVDEVYLSNYLSAFEEPGYTITDRALFQDMEPVKEALEAVKKKSFSVQYQLPTLLKRTTRRHCKVYFTHIRIDGNGDVGACGCMLLNLAGNGTFDDPDVWNNEYFRTMRAAYLDHTLPIPSVCEFCTNNQPTTS